MINKTQAIIFKTISEIIFVIYFPTNMESKFIERIDNKDTVNNILVGIFRDNIIIRKILLSVKSVMNTKEKEEVNACKNEVEVDIFR